MNLATDKLRETLVSHASWKRGDNVAGERPVLCRCGAVLKPDYRTSEPTEEIAWTEHVRAALAGAASAGPSERDRIIREGLESAAVQAIEFISTPTTNVYECPVCFARDDKVVSKLAMRHEESCPIGRALGATSKPSEPAGGPAGEVSK